MKKLALFTIILVICNLNYVLSNEKIDKCTKTEELPAGPFYIPSIEQNQIAKKIKGEKIIYIIKIINKNCKPLNEVKVDIWQAKIDGKYNIDNKGLLRGYQKTNKKGEVSFYSVLPGWYVGRALHLHIKVGNNYYTQIFFPETVNKFYKKDVYKDRGVPDTSNGEDNLFMSLSNPKKNIFNVKKNKYYITIVI